MDLQKKADGPSKESGRTFKRKRTDLQKKADGSSKESGWTFKRKRTDLQKKADGIIVNDQGLKNRFDILCPIPGIISKCNQSAGQDIHKRLLVESSR